MRVDVEAWKKVESFLIVQTTEPPVGIQIQSQETYAVMNIVHNKPRLTRNVPYTNFFSFGFTKMNFFFITAPKKITG